MYVSYGSARDESLALTGVTTHLDSFSSVLGDGYEWVGEVPEGDGVVQWLPSHVDVHPDVCSSPGRLAIRVQLLQAAHFIFHRLNSLNRYPGRKIEQVIVKGGPHNGSEKHDHVRFDLSFLHDDGVLSSLAIHVKYAWAAGEKKKKFHTGFFLWTLGYTERKGGPSRFF